MIQAARESGKRVVLVRHPMPYGDLAKQVCGGVNSKSLACQLVERRPNHVCVHVFACCACLRLYAGTVTAASPVIELCHPTPQAVQRFEPLSGLDTQRTNIRPWHATFLV